MALDFGCPLDAEHASRIAEMVVGAARGFDGTVLDYTPASIAEVDRLISALRDQGIGADTIAESLVSMGCYVGEILVRTHGASWRDGGIRELALAGVRLVVDIPDRGWCNPILVAVQRHRTDDSSSLHDFYCEAIGSEAA